MSNKLGGIGNGNGSLTGEVYSIQNAVPSVEAVTTTDEAGGANDGRLEKGDTITFDFSKSMDLGTFCSGWTGTLIGGNNNVSVALNNDTAPGTGFDALSVTAAATCPAGFHLGAVDLGSAGYRAAGGGILFGANGNGNDSQITWNATTNALTIKFGNRSGGIPGVVPASSIKYTPHSSLRDLDNLGFPTSPITYTFNSPTVAQF